MSIHSRQAADRSRRALSGNPSLVQQLGRRVESWFHERVFARDLAQLSRGGRALNMLLRTAYLSARGFFEDACIFRASALTYITVLSIVPLLAFSFALAKGMGFYHVLLNDTIRPFLDRTFGTYVEDALASAGGEGHEMRAAIERVLSFVEKTNVSGLGALGLVLLVYTVIKLLSTIEESFNDIWGVHRSRSVVRKVTDYLAMLVVAPILLFTAAGLTAAAENSSALDYLDEHLHLHVGVLFALLLKVAPLISLWLAFAFVYIAMPNARTRWSSALLGALVGGSLWQLALLAHIHFQVGIARYNAIYSGFAAIPIFLVWVQLSWVAVLLGAEVCFAHQSAASYYPDSPTSANPRARELIALRLLTRIAARSIRAEAPWTAADLACELNVSLRPVELVLNELVDGKLLAVARQQGADVFLLAVDLDRIQVKTVLDVLRGPPPRAPDGPRSALDAELDACLVGLDETLAESRHNLPLRSLAEQDQPTPVPECAAPTELGRKRHG